MPNHSLIAYNEPTPDQMIDELIDFLEDKVSYQNPTSYTIIEYFPLNKPEPYTSKVYNLTNLTMEKENGIVTSSDMDGNFPNLQLALSAFLVDDILYIGFQNNDKKVTVSFAYGYIQIKY